MSVSLTLYSEWIRDLNVRPENLKALHGNTCELLQDASLGKDLSQRTATAQEIIQENHRLEPMRLETYCAARSQC